MNITDILPTDLAGYCDAQTGECITTETGTSHDTTAEDLAPTDDQSSTVSDDSENRA